MKLFQYKLTLQRIVIIFTVLGFLLYFNTLSNKFVWDDNIYIVGNLKIQHFDLGVLFGPNNIFNAEGFYRPLSATYFAVIYFFTKNSPFLYHLLQIALHITNVYLVFLLLEKFLKKGKAFFLSLIFLVHPIQVESVAFIGATQSPLLFIFGISALLLIMRGKSSNKHLAWAFILIFLSMLTKEVGVLFLLLLILYFILFRREELKKLWIPSIIVITFYLFVRFVIGQTGFTSAEYVPIGNLTFWQRLVNIPAIFFYYLKTFLFPKNLAIDQLWHINKLSPGNFYFPLLADIVFFGLTALLGFYKFKNKNRFYSFIFFFVWFFLGMAMLMQVFPLDMTVADRWFYFPIVGLLGLIGLAIDNFRLPKNMSVGLAAVILIVLSIRTFVRIGDWQNAITLYGHDIKIEDNYDLENNLGFELAITGKYDEAQKHFERSISMNPYEFNLRNMGSLYATLGDVKTAKDYYAKALQAKSYIGGGKHYFELTYTSYAELLLYAFDDPKDTMDAKNTLDLAVSDYPQSAELWKLLSLANYRLGNKNEALVNILTAQRLKNDSNYRYIQTQIANDRPAILNIQKPWAPNEKPDVVFQPSKN